MANEKLKKVLARTGEVDSIIIGNDVWFERAAPSAYRNMKVVIGPDGRLDVSADTSKQMIWDNSTMNVIDIDPGTQTIVVEVPVNDNIMVGNGHYIFRMKLSKLSEADVKILVYPYINDQSNTMQPRSVNMTGPVGSTEIFEYSAPTRSEIWPGDVVQVMLKGVAGSARLLGDEVNTELTLIKTEQPITIDELSASGASVPFVSSARMGTAAGEVNIENGTMIFSGPEDGETNTIELSVNGITYIDPSAGTSTEMDNDGFTYIKGDVTALVSKDQLSYVKDGYGIVANDDETVMTFDAAVHDMTITFDNDGIKLERDDVDVEFSDDEISFIKDGSGVVLDEDGIHLEGDATQFEDLQVSLANMDADNPNPPLWKISNAPNSLSNGLTIGPANADTNMFINGYAQSLINVANKPDWTLSMWIRIDDGDCSLFELKNGLRLFLNNGRLRMEWGEESRITILNNTVIGKWYNVTFININDMGDPGARIRCYVDTVKKVDKFYANTYLDNIIGHGWSFGSSLSALGTTPLLYGNLGLAHLSLSSQIASTAKIAEIYNGGVPRTESSVFADGFNIPLLGNLDNLVGVDPIMVNTNYSWSVISSTAFAIKGRYFEQNMLQQLQFSTQVPHALRTGAGLPFHLHIKPEDAVVSGSEPIFKLAYVVVNVGEDEGDIITITSDSFNYLADGKHGVIIFPEIATTNAGATIMPSAMIEAVLYRANDSHAGGVFLKQADFHIEMDSFGTNDEWHD